jgi:hypothetical protein
MTRDTESQKHRSYFGAHQNLASDAQAEHSTDACGVLGLKVTNRTLYFLALAQPGRAAVSQPSRQTRQYGFPANYQKDYARKRHEHEKRPHASRFADILNSANDSEDR